MTVGKTIGGEPSPCSLKYGRALAEAHPNRSIVQQPVALLPWGHVKYALRHTAMFSVVAAFHITAALPTGLRDSLPSVRQLEAEWGAPSRERA